MWKNQLTYLVCGKINQTYSYVYINQTELYNIYIAKSVKLTHMCPYQTN